MRRQEVRGDVAIAHRSNEEAVDLGRVLLVRIAGLCSSHADAERYGQHRDRGGGGRLHVGVRIHQPVRRDALAVVLGLGSWAYAGARTPAPTARGTPTPAMHVAGISAA